MVSDLRIGPKKISALHVCLVYVVDTMPRAPHARGHMHVPFYEGMCQNLLRATGETLKQLQSGITVASDDRIDSNFFV